MAAYQMSSFYRPPTVDTNHNAHSYFDDDDGNVLDDDILEQTVLEGSLDISPPMGPSRRNSYAVSSTIFSPKTEDWQHTSNPFGDHSANSFMAASQPANFGQNPHSWPMGHGSGACTPMLPFDAIPTEYEQAQGAYRPTQGQTSFTNAANQVALFSPSNTSTASAPPSPQRDWAESLEHRVMPKRMRNGSPGLRSHSPSHRRDGIRKKNARFEIPAERNLLNIDQLIAHSTDDQEIKELKQQKRLLRNRQAALDSRQRKKQHTERLEDEKKHYTAAITDLEDQIMEAQVALDDYSRKEQQYQQYIENLQLEKEEMLRTHTIETGELRKKVSILTEHVHKMEQQQSTAMSAATSSTGYSNDYVTELDGLTMDSAWEGISFLNDYTVDQPPQQHQTIIKAEPATNMSATRSLLSTKKTESDEKPAAAQGLLLMLLLFGAFVASKGPTTNNTTAPSIPQMSDDIRAASATLLHDIFSDAGLSATPNAPASWPASTTAPLSLTTFADTLSQPSAAQHTEQLFSLSAAQYSGLHQEPTYQDNAAVPQPSQTRRNLADSLAAMRRKQSGAGAAEVYTRSLLWDQVPRDVVRDFARMVEECGGGVA